jgi:hypothetical protein
MTHVPTLDEVMNGSPFDIIDSPWGHIERWRASTLATGTMGALASVYSIVRSDSAEATARADADQARVAVFKDLLQKIDALTSRCDALASENATLKAKARDDAARQARFDEEVTLPPDIFEKQTSAPPSAIGDDGDADEHHPAGDLHEVAPKEEPLSEGDDNIGDLPKELIEEPEPVPEPRGRVYPQPVAISLNEG